MWCKRGAFQGCLLKTCACLHCYSQRSHPHLVTGYCHQRMLLSPVILEEKVVKLRLCRLFCFPTSYLYGLFPFFFILFFSTSTLISDWLKVQFRGTPLAFFMVFEARTPRTIKHQENVSREEFETPENTLLVRWQIGRDMAKEQKIMDETEKVDWDPLFFHF